MYKTQLSPRMRFSCTSWIAAFVVLLSACTTSDHHARSDHDALAENSSPQASDPAQAGVRSTFILLDPYTDKPKANTRYRLTLTTARIISASRDTRVLTDQLAEGTTDAQGRTGALYLDREEPEQPSLVEKVGSGAYGTAFVLRSRLGPVVRDWYEIRSCPGSAPYRGFSDRQGSTVYLTSDKPCKATLRVGRDYNPHPDDDFTPPGGRPIEMRR